MLTYVVQNVLLIGLLALAGVILVAQGIFTIGPYRRAAIERFGDYTGRVVESGLNWKIPFFDTYEEESIERMTVKFHFNLQTSDGVPTEVSGQIGYRPGGGQAFIVWLGISKEEDLQKDLVENAKTIISDVIGNTGQSDLVNCQLKLQNVVTAILCLNDRERADRGHTSSIAGKALLDLYPAPLRQDAINSSTSEVEDLYGIQIEVVAVNDPTFDQETARLLALKKHNELRKEAASVLANAVREEQAAQQALGQTPLNAGTHARSLYGVVEQTGETINTIQTGSGTGVIPVQHYEDPRTIRPTRSGRKDGK